MRRSVLALAAAFAVAAFGLVSASVAADGYTSLTGTSVWSTTSGQPGSFGLLATSTAINGTFTGRLGQGTYSGTLTGGPSYQTLSCGPTCEDVTGTISFTSTRGDFTASVDPGSTVALEDIASTSWRAFTLRLTIVDGTRAYSHANGQMSLTYLSTFTHDYESIGPGGQLVYVSRVDDAGSLSGNPH